MLVGCAVVLYAFSVTFWQHEPVATPTVELPQVETSSGGAVTTGSPVLRSSTTTTSPAVDGAPRRPQRPVPSGNESRLPSVRESTSSSSPVERPLENPEDPTVSRVGERSQGVTVNRSSQDLDPSAVRESPRSEPIVPRTPSAPPSGEAEAQKRNESRTPSTPPVRTSLMGRRPQ
jgi:hypothetical protein